MGPQINALALIQASRQFGANLAILSPGATQTLVQLGGPTANVTQSNVR
jgi:hypothetical protein